jgi:hypothetical protein
MSKGFEAIRNYRKEVEAKREARDSMTFTRNTFFKLADGESAVVRFGEQGDEINAALIHRIPNPNLTFPENVPCLDQHNKGVPCPACDSPDFDIRKKSLRGFITLVWRDAPVYELDENGKKTKNIVGNEDQVAIWSQGVRVFGQLDELDSEYKGLTSRDFKIKRTGSKVDNTTYTIMPLDESPLSATDAKLLGEKPDLNRYVTPPTYEEMAEKLGMPVPSVISGEDADVTQVFKSDPFAAARKNREKV